MFFLPVKVLSRLFHRLVLEQFAVAHAATTSSSLATLLILLTPRAFANYLTPLRVATSNSRLVAMGENGVTFKWKDYRGEGRERQIGHDTRRGGFICRVLTHVLSSRFHRIRHYGLFANGNRAAAMIARARELLGVPAAR